MQTSVLTWKYLLMSALTSCINDLISMAARGGYAMLSILGQQAAQVMLYNSRCQRHMKCQITDTLCNMNSTSVVILISIRYV